MDDPILEALAMVLDPLPADMRETMLELAKREISERPLIGFCWDGIDGGEQDASGNEIRPWAYEVAKPSPRFPGRTVFAMFHWEEQNAIAAFTFERVEGPNGQDIVQFYREVIFTPKIVSGPLKPQALLNEFLAFMGEPDGGDGPQPAPPRVNGRASP